jgi:hypothetical protein
MKLNPSGMSAPLRFLIHGNHGPEIKSSFASRIQFADLLLKWDQGFMAIEKHGLPKTIECEVISLAKRTCDVVIRLVVVDHRRCLRAQLLGVRL